MYIRTVYVAGAQNAVTRGQRMMESFRPGIYRRRIVLQFQNGEARADLEDDQHRMSIVVHHDGTHVTTVDGLATRTPWLLCPTAADELPARTVVAHQRIGVVRPPHGQAEEDEHANVREPRDPQAPRPLNHRRQPQEHDQLLQEPVAPANGPNSQHRGQE